MDEKIKLNNGYYLKIVNNDKKIEANIENIKLINIIKNKKLILKIDFKSINKKQYKKILKRLLHIKQLIKINKKIKIGEIEENEKILGYIVNYNNTKEQNDFISAIDAIFQPTRYERYNYIYDAVCDYLDSFFYGKNLCDFKDNKCGEKRNTASTTGCCHHFKNKWLGPFSKLVLCEYLTEDHTCGAKCLGCKLFTCDYLEKKGIKFRMKDILLLDVFFNPIQKYFIKYMVFTPKEKVLKRIMML